MDNILLTCKDFNCLHIPPHTWSERISIGSGRFDKEILLDSLPYSRSLKT